MRGIVRGSRRDDWASGLGPSGAAAAARQAARAARGRLASALEVQAQACPELQRALPSVIATLYQVEVQSEAEAMAASLGEALSALKDLQRDERLESEEAIAGALRRACVDLYPALRALAPGGGRRDSTSPFLLTSSRVKPGDAPEGEPERRDGLRHELEVEVGLEGANRFFTGRTGDLSRGGLFVATEEPLPVGTEVLLSFVLPGGHHVRSEARVAWVRAPRYRPHELPAGMGIRFSRIEPDDLGAIRHFLEERPAFHYGDE